PDRKPSSRTRLRTSSRKLRQLTPKTRECSFNTSPRNKDRRSMEFAGKWVLCNDDGVRPMIEVHAFAMDGTKRPENFLIDSGADQTVFSAEFLQRLGFPITPLPPGSTLIG